MSKEITIGRDAANEVILAHVNEVITISPDEQSYFLSLLKYKKVSAGNIYCRQKYETQITIKSFFSTHVHFSI